MKRRAPQRTSIKGPALADRHYKQGQQASGSKPWRLQVVKDYSAWQAAIDMLILCKPPVLKLRLSRSSHAVSPTHIRIKGLVVPIQKKTPHSSGSRTNTRSKIHLSKRQLIAQHSDPDNFDKLCMKFPVDFGKWPSN